MSNAQGNKLIGKYVPDSYFTRNQVVNFNVKSAIPSRPLYRTVEEIDSEIFASVLRNIPPHYPRSRPRNSYGQNSKQVSAFSQSYLQKQRLDSLVSGSSTSSSRSTSSSTEGSYQSVARAKYESGGYHGGRSYQRRRTPPRNTSPSYNVDRMLASSPYVKHGYHEAYQRREMSQPSRRISGKPTHHVSKLHRKGRNKAPSTTSYSTSRSSSSSSSSTSSTSRSSSSESFASTSSSSSASKFTYSSSESRESRKKQVRRHHKSYASTRHHPNKHTKSQAKEPVKSGKRATSTPMPMKKNGANNDEPTCKKCGRIKPLYYEYDEKKQKPYAKKSILNNNSQPSRKHKVMIQDE
nr:expressed conserved protein [Hymenolepis microstoma]